MPDEILCIVEIPKGSRNKYEYDEEREIILLDRFLSSSVVFPTDYGFVPETLGPDGEDPLDVMVAVSEPTFPGCGIMAKPVAVLELEDQGEREPKVLCVPCEDPNWQDINDLDDLPQQLREEIAHSSWPTSAARTTRSRFRDGPRGPTPRPSSARLANASARGDDRRRSGGRARPPLRARPLTRRLHGSAGVSAPPARAWAATVRPRRPR